MGPDRSNEGGPGIWKNWGKRFSILFPPHSSPELVRRQADACARGRSLPGRGPADDVPEVLRRQVGRRGDVSGIGFFESGVFFVGRRRAARRRGGTGRRAGTGGTRAGTGQVHHAKWWGSLFVGGKCDRFMFVNGV